MREKLCNSIYGVSANAGEDVLEPCEGIDFGTLTRSNKTAQHCSSSAADILTKNIQLVRPRAMPRMLRSVAELSISRLPSST
jgi:hypothetical protein